MATVKIPSPLRKFTDNKSEISSERETVLDSIKDATSHYPDLQSQLFDDQGSLRSFIRIYVGEEDIKVLNGSNTVVNRDSVISIIPAIAGGKY